MREVCVLVFFFEGLEAVDLKVDTVLVNAVAGVQVGEYLGSAFLCYLGKHFDAEAENSFRECRFEGSRAFMRVAKATEKWMTALTENELSNVIIGAAIEVHKELGGPGLLENKYLRLSNRKLGLVINFGESLVKGGVHRVVNNL